MCFVNTSFFFLFKHFRKLFFIQLLVNTYDSLSFSVLQEDFSKKFFYLIRGFTKNIGELVTDMRLTAA